MKLGKKFNYMMSSCACADFYSRNSFRLTKKNPKPKNQQQKQQTNKNQKKKQKKKTQQTNKKNPQNQKTYHQKLQFVHIVTWMCWSVHRCKCNCFPCISVKSNRINKSSCFVRLLCGSVCYVMRKSSQCQVKFKSSEKTLKTLKVTAFFRFVNDTSV